MTKNDSVPAAGYQLIGCDRGRKVIKSNMPGEELTICDPDLAETEAAIGRPVTIVDPKRGFILAAIQMSSTPSEPRSHSMILYLKPAVPFAVQQGEEIAERAARLLQTVADDAELAFVSEETVLELTANLPVPEEPIPASPEVYEDVFEEVVIDDAPEGLPMTDLTKRHMTHRAKRPVTDQKTGTDRPVRTKPTNRSQVLNPSKVSVKKTPAGDYYTRRRRSDDEIMGDKIRELLSPYTVACRPDAIFPMIRKVLRYYMSIYNRRGVVSADRMMELFREAVRKKLGPVYAAKRRSPLLPVYLFLISMYTPGDYFHILETEFMPPPFWFDDMVCERELRALFPGMGRGTRDRILYKVADFNDRFLADNDREGDHHG